ncbi:MAG: oligoendopeptidase F [Oscillospiraceae bacterium]|jgi:oligoendopeptidase F|nr:oligoendopeptidase F [Oscillospiraceae bacterium]
MSAEVKAAAAKERSAIDPQWKWRLEDIFESNDAWDEQFQLVTAALPELERAVAGVAAAAHDKSALRAAVLNALSSMYGVQENMFSLFSYARMRRDEDNRVSRYQGLVQRAESLATEISACAAALKPALLALPEGTLETYIDDPEFADYDKALRDALRARPHTLLAEQEKLIAQAGEIFSAPSNIFDMLSDADMKFPTILDEEGNPVEVTDAKYGTFVESRDRRVRREAYEAHNGAYKAFGNTIAAAYAASVKVDQYYARTHKYESALAASLEPNGIPLSVYDELIRAVRAHLPSLAKYMKVRAKALGVEELHLYDQYVNLESGFSVKLPYPEGFELVMQALAPLGAAYVDMLRGAYKSGWIDVYENAGKSSGAYSWGTYRTHPFVLLNYDDGSYSDISTIAHELGHSMHTQFSRTNQPFAKAEYELFTAEVASTVNEILLSIYMQNKYNDTTARRFLIGELLNGFRGTVFRQTMFAEFEKESHSMSERGEPLTCESLTEMYKALNETYYGEAVVIDEIVGAEWMRIPHFYRAFYVYQYATGYSAAAFIARRILREGQPAVDDYFRFLKAGGSLPPIDALRLAGVDMAKKEAVDEALNWFDELVEEYAGMF